MKKSFNFKTLSFEIDRKLKILYYVAGIFSIAFLLLIGVGCSKDSITDNQKPKLDVVPVTAGLMLTLTGGASDADGTITELRIIWGDETIDRFSNNDFKEIKISHTYIIPATYTITVIVKDNDGDSTIKNITAPVDFIETSLAGIKESMFKKSDHEYLILTLNLHTYQEAQQNEKFNLITDVIGKMNIDFIALQECAQNKSAAIYNGIIREDNAALILSNRLKQKYNQDYNFTWHWAHYGWDIWEEGVSVLSKYPLIDTDNRYVSTGTGTANITSRKVIYGSYQLPVGRINVFSAHTHWRTSLTDEEQTNQIRNIKAMVLEKEIIAQGSTSFVCGDFNGNPTSDYPWSEGYNTMMENNEYIDTFFDIYPDANSKPPQNIYNTIGGDFPGRIDYIFMKNNAHFTVVDSQIIFKNDIVGNVSDHFGVLSKVAYSK